MQSLKLSLKMKNSCYQILGLGAIFTAPDWRNHGLATDLVEEVIAKAEEKGLDGLLLFSAIDKNFYFDFGFESLGSLDFEICPNNYSDKNIFLANKIDTIRSISIEIRSAKALCKADQVKNSSAYSFNFHFSSFEPWFSENELEEMLRCYQRWLARQPYGIDRNNFYFSFQLAKFIYFATYSTTHKASWFLTIAKNERKRIIGYAITECSGTSMRILELVGEDEARIHLWQNLIEQAKSMKLMHIRGFESIVRDFIPSCGLDSSLFSLKPMLKVDDILCYERLWSQPMFLALNPDLSDLPNIHPCPLLEFDYF